MTFEALCTLSGFNVDPTRDTLFYKTSEMIGLKGMQGQERPMCSQEEVNRMIKKMQDEKADYVELFVDWDEESPA